MAIWDLDNICIWVFIYKVKIFWLMRNYEEILDLDDHDNTYYR